MRTNNLECQKTRPDQDRAMVSSSPELRLESETSLENSFCQQNVQKQRVFLQQTTQSCMKEETCVTPVKSRPWRHERDHSLPSLRFTSFLQLFRIAC